MEDERGHTKYYPVLVEIWVIKLGALHVVKLRTCVALERFQVKRAIQLTECMNCLLHVRLHFVHVVILVPHLTIS